MIDVSETVKNARKRNGHDDEAVKISLKLKLQRYRSNYHGKIVFSMR